jgi:hypothetical protein
MTAAFFISPASAMIAPDRLTEVEVAGIRCCANGRAADSADGSACRYVTRRRADQSAGAGTNQTAGHGTVTR